MFVYILHFHSTLNHAQHYVGSTGDVKQRLAAHAAGEGANITKVITQAGNHWTLAGLFQSSVAKARQHERKLKDQKNTPNYCEVCNPSAPNLPGTTRYPLASLPWPIDSRKIEPSQKASGTIIIRQNNGPGLLRAMDTTADIAFTIGEMHKAKAELGFIPNDGVRRAYEEGKLLICENNGDRVGYTIFTAQHSRDIIKIQQLYVRDDARLLHHGRCLIEAVASRFPTSALQAKVRDDLPANIFWEALDFSRMRQSKHKTSGHTLNHYHRNPLI